ncbi:hypothetical protein Nepgr_003128 [Nepenthes gracilis]|uniref:Uncharacterized protein n=1 Tax=Nepenthes gracilis TaxID=150966 RepID=A0AAD3XCZ9_NEPGR|nr:hypothetical protein Nepgr_003128 [Nepenthes gracilis]
MAMAVAESTGSGVPLPQSSCSEKRPSLVVVLSIFCNFNSIENHTAGIILAESRCRELRYALSFQPEDTFEKEDFQEVANLKFVISKATSKDAVSVIISELKKATDEE